LVFLDFFSFIVIFSERIRLFTYSKEASGIFSKSLYIYGVVEETETTLPFINL